LILCAVQVLAVIIMAGMMFFNKDAQSQSAFDTGRFITIDVKTGKIEGNVTTTVDKTLSEEQYRLQRITELTGKSNEEVKKELQASYNQEQTSKQETKIISSITPSRPIKSPLNLDYHADIIEKMTDDLSLPRINEEKGVVPWRIYAKAGPAEKGDHQLSLVITNLGLNPVATEQALEMNEYVTLAFSPYALHISEQIKMARASGFETWLTLPLQHENYPVHDYGPLTLLEEVSLEDNITQLHQLLNNNHGIVGLIALPDEKYSRSIQMGGIFEEIDRRGLLLTLYHPFFSANSTHGKILHARPHLHGGNIPSESAELFRTIESYAVSEKHTIITLAAMPTVMKEMNEWIASLPAKNITLVPLSGQIVEKK
jgi:polysaccharide deacetylase 2 family uncharacterized protein YibQ